MCGGTDCNHRDSEQNWNIIMQSGEEGKGHTKATVTTTRKKYICKRSLKNTYAIIQILGKLLKFGAGNTQR